MRALEGCGFLREGLLRSYLKGSRDAFIYSLLPSDLKQVELSTQKQRGE
jgi:RimJ/RimL family protein N-acetyltransferase